MAGLSLGDTKMSTVQRFSRVVLALSLVGVLSGYASAAQRSDDQTSKDKSTHQSRMEARHNAGLQNTELQRASRIIGKTVKSNDGRTLGTVYDIVLTPDHTAVSYVALSRGGAFGLNRDLYAVPWSSFKTGINNTYYLPVSVSQLEAMNGFKEAYWPATPTRGWASTTPGANTMEFQGVTREESRDIQNRRVSKIVGTNVDDVQGRNSGDIKDFVIARDTGTVEYAIVSYGGIFGIGSRFAAVPPSAIDIRPEQNTAKLTVDRSTLTANSFSPMRWPDLSSPSFQQRVAAAYGSQPVGATLGYVPPQSNVTTEPRADIENPSPVEPPAPMHEYQMPAATSPSGVVSINPSNVKTIEGTVVDTGRLGTPGAGMVGLRLKTGDGRTVLVNLGPRDYIGKQNFLVIDGDHVAITGADTSMGGRSMFVATQVSRDGQILKLRDPNGHPLWLESATANENAQPQTPAYSESSADTGHAPDME